MKLNNKGFAITTVLYGTLVLFLLLITSMLGMLSLNKDRMKKLESGAKEIINSPYVPVDSCTLTLNFNDDKATIEADVYPASISVSYKWNDDSTSKNLEIDSAGDYSLTVTDNKDKSVSCDIRVFEKTQYSKRKCKNSNKRFGNWWISSNGYEYNCTQINPGTYSIGYKTCETPGSEYECSMAGLIPPCKYYENYTRYVHCDKITPADSDESWEEWQEWQDKVIEDDSKNYDQIQVKTRKLLYTR